MASHRRRLAAVLVLVGASAALALVLAHASSTTGRSAVVRPGASRLAHESIAEQQQNGEAADGPEAQAYADRAYPASEVTPAETQGAIKANEKLQKKGPGASFGKWDFLGPDTLNVDKFGTQSFIKPTQWSGRETAVTMGHCANNGDCTVFVGAAGGGVWRTNNALTKQPNWKPVSADIPTNAIGSVAVDPNDATGQTVYAGTGEGNASGDSEAGLGLYRSTDEGNHWSLVPGSVAVANNRSIVWVAVQPGDPNHILIGTRSGTRAENSNSSQVGAVGTPTLPALGVYASTDGGASFSLVLTGTANEVKFDPNDSNTVYATIAGSATGGLLRSQSGGTVGSWTPIFQENRSRFTFSPVPLPNGKTRIYLGDANGAGQGAHVYRINDASQPAATLTASSNAAWTRLSNPTDGTPGFAVYNYCVSAFGGQCSYDMSIMSPPDRPDMVVVAGLMHYEELGPYEFQVGQVVGPRSNGRAVLVSFDSGATWNDMTGDVGGESMHPDQHAIAFVPGDPDKVFVGSDGGLIRTSGQWADASGQCDERGLDQINPAYVTECKQWLSKIPSELQPVNAGLGTIQMYSISVSPFKDNEAMTGLQDNGTVMFTGSKTWELPLTGDGCDSGFDATDPHFRFHTYTNGQMDINYDDFNQNTWLWIGDRFVVNFPEADRFCSPTVSDPVRTKTMFVGAQSVWRTSDGGGDRAFLEAHCNVTTIPGKDASNLQFTGACGSAADWPKLGTSTLTNSGATSPYGQTKGGNTIAALSRGQDLGTMWAGTGAGRVLISKNINAADPTAVTFTRLDDDSPATPNRAVSSIYADPTNSNHAIVTFSGFNVSTANLPGHVFDVVFNPSTGLSTWTDISYDIGDQPVNDAVLDTATGDIYISTDFSVFVLTHGAQAWTPVSDGLPMVAVSGLTLAKAQHGPNRFIYAATHGRGAYRLTLRPGPR
jgi:hypothetical protein